MPNKKQYPLVTIDPARRVSSVSKLLYGACIEDVNHELYGGIWSQMIFGESFEEPPMLSEKSGFRITAGRWYLKADEEGEYLAVDRTANAPKLLLSPDVTDGCIEADVNFTGDAAGFLLQVTNPEKSTDRFDGYEISLHPQILRIVKHRHGQTLGSDTPCAAIAPGTWLHLRAECSENTLSVTVNGESIASYTDCVPPEKGAIGLRVCSASARFKNIRIESCGKPLPFSFEKQKHGGDCAGMWESELTGPVKGRTSLVTDAPFTNTRALRLCIDPDSTGGLAVNNKGLNRSGMSFLSGREYEGYLYVKSESPVTLYVAMESGDGTRRYAESTLDITGGSGYEKYSFRLTPDATDHNGRFTIELREPGRVDLGYAFLQAGPWGRYKGLPVRRDVGEMLEKQGITLLRLGGSMTNVPRHYRWKRMLHEPEKRGAYPGFWYPYSSYGFGILEFLNLCEALGILGIPDFSSFETAEDMSDFAHYAYGTDESDPWVRLRMQMGHPSPYDLPFIQIGNEEKIDAVFAERFNAAVNAVWAFKPDVIPIVGDFIYKQEITDPAHFTGNPSGVTNLDGHRMILENAAARGKTVYFDIHFNSAVQPEPFSYLAPSISFYNALRSVCPSASTGVCVLELNAHVHHFERALCNALAIQFAERHSDVIKMMCSANALQVQGQNDNEWNQGLVFMDNHRVWYQPAAYIDRLYLDAYQPFALRCPDEICETAAHDSGADSAVSDGPCREDSVFHTEAFDLTATTDADGRTVCIKILNRTGEEADVPIAIPSFRGERIRATIIEYADSGAAVNTADDPDKSRPSSPLVNETRFTDEPMRISTKAYSVTIVTLTRL